MRTLLAVAFLALLPASVSAQSLAERVAATRDGAVTFHFASRPGACGDGEHYASFGGNASFGRFDGRSPRRPCVRGPAQVRLTRANGETTRIESWVGTPRTRDGARDLGVVPAPEAARYLLDLGARGASAIADDAMLPAVLADSTVVWPGLLAIARDGERARGVRQAAAFWLSRFAQAKLLGHPEDLGASEPDEEGDAELRRHAVFVLSQRPRHEGVPALIQVARTHRDPQVRGNALFWLAQSGDERGLDVMEEVLR